MRESSRSFPRNYKTPSRFPRLWGGLASIALTAAISIANGCAREAKPPAAPPAVEIVSVQQKDVPITREYVATLTGLENAQIRAQVEGYLVKQLYTNGAYVKKGAPLFQLDPRPYQAAVDKAAGQIEQAKANLEKANAMLGKAQLDVERYTPLAKKGAISQQELDDAVQEKLAAEGQVAAAKAEIVVGRAASETAQLNLQYARIVSPVDGVAGISSAQIGNLVGPNNQNALSEVSTVNPILATITPSEQDYLKLMSSAAKTGRSDTEILDSLVWQLELNDGSIYPQKGTFYALDRQVNVQTGAITVQIKFPNPGNVLRPGGFGKLRSVVQIEKDALVVPQRAVTDVQGKYLVAVVSSDNKVNIRPVEVGDRLGTLWVIARGLQNGDHVVAEGTQKVHEGLLVNPIPFQPSNQTASVNSKPGEMQ